jgi:2-oxoisovalerate dehydrogenase E1 component
MPHWPSVLRTVFVSRALDSLEESRLVPERKVLYQFCARGHDVTQALLGQQLTGRRDAVAPYYRSRPLALSLGLPPEEALASTMMRAEGMSGGRDIGVVINRPNRDGPCLLPACGGVGAQYTPATGWAQSLVYRARVMKDAAVAGSIAVAHGGEASTATNGFWASLNIATTERLPLLYFIEDNGYGISVPSRRQTPGGDVAANLAAFRNLRILAGDAAEPLASASLIEAAVQAVRAGEGPVFLKLRVPRLSGHSAQDTQAYKSAEEIADEQARDPLAALEKALVPTVLSAADWRALQAEGEGIVREALDRIESRPPLSPAGVERHVFTERRADGSLELQVQGGQLADGATPPVGTAATRPEGARINMLTAIRRTLEHELAVNPRVLVFGEDVGRKGGVYNVTHDLQKRFGAGRVFDTLLDETSILGIAQGAAHAGLLPIPEIQYLAYIHNALDQIRGEAASLQFFSSGQFRNPMVVRVPGLAYQKGFGGHFHNDNSVGALRDIPGLVLAVPSNGPDAARMLRGAIAMALEDGRVVIFLEPIALYHERDLHAEGDGGWLFDYPAPPDHLLPGEAGLYGEAATDLLIVSYANGLRMSLQAQAILDREHGVAARVLDLRWLNPLPVEAVRAHAADCGSVLVVDECRATGAGVADALIADLAETGFAGRVASVRAVDSFVPLGTATAAVLVGLDQVVAAAVEAAQRSTAGSPTP